MFDFEVKDSGQRAEFDGGMVRDSTANKTDFLLIRDGVMFRRWAEHLRLGAIKYTKRNWMKGRGDEVASRFRESAARHFEAWLDGETDEDHAAGVFFNINGYETLGTSTATLAGCLKKAIDDVDKAGVMTFDEASDTLRDRYSDEINGDEWYL